MSIFENFSVDRFLFSLRYMWQGMLCIFAVITVIILCVILMNFISKKFDNKKEKNEKTEIDSEK